MSDHSHIIDMAHAVELRTSHATLLAALNEILSFSADKRTADIARNAIRSLPASLHRFPNVSCSQCGHDFGPGDSGFSHCENHAGKPAVRHWGVA